MGKLPVVSNIITVVESSIDNLNLFSRQPEYNCGQLLKSIVSIYNRANIRRLDLFTKCGEHANGNKFAHSEQKVTWW